MGEIVISSPVRKLASGRLHSTQDGRTFLAVLWNGDVKVIESHRTSISVHDFALADDSKPIVDAAFQRLWTNQVTVYMATHDGGALMCRAWTSSSGRCTALSDMTTTNVLNVPTTGSSTYTFQENVSAGVRAVYAGKHDHGYYWGGALLSDSSIVGWGRNAFSLRDVVDPVSGRTPIVATGHQDSFSVLTAEGHVMFPCGRDRQGSEGGRFIHDASPTVLTGFQAVASNKYQGCAVTASYDVWCFGYGPSGTLR